MPISDTVLGMIIGGLFTLGGSVSVGVIHYLRTKTEVEAENKRLRAELYMERKVDRLATLHAELEECQREFIRILDRVPAEKFGEEGEIEEAENLIGEFEVAMDEASVFLAEDQHEIVLEYFDMLGKVNSSFQGWAYEPANMRGGDLYKDRRKKLILCYRDVKELLQEEIREPIERLD